MSPALAALAPTVAHLRLWWGLTWLMFMVGATGVLWYRMVTGLGRMLQPGRCTIQDIQSAGQWLRAAICLLVLVTVVPI